MAFFQAATLLVATVTTGLSAGLLFGFAGAVMPGLGAASDRTVVEAMQRINVAILNPWFFTAFVGAPVLVATTAALHVPADSRVVLPWVLVALALYLVGLVITGRVNIPLNDRLMAAGDPAHLADSVIRAVRERFEARWVRWNVVRTVAFVAAFGCLCWALVRHGQL